MFNMNRQPMFQSPRRQRGAVLIVSLLLLLVVTILALGSGQSTRLQERIAGSQRNFDLAFQSAEAALRAGERWIEEPSRVRPPVPCNMLRNPPCEVYERDFMRGQVPYAEQAFQDDDWWTAWAQRYAPAAEGNLISGAGMALRDPLFYIEEVEEVPDSLAQPTSGPPPTRIYYRVIARGEGGTDDATVVLHSTYVRRY
jgi:type IV pilus assembly protein PilX